MTSAHKIILQEIVEQIGPAIRGISPPKAAAKRPSTKAIYKALKTARNAIQKRFGGPVLCRYSGCLEDREKKYSRNSRVFKVLEYLWDFSFSRYAIPQAIEDLDAIPIASGKFELLFVAESELGTKDEICRDLLKLLEARTSIRCLVYKCPKRVTERHDFEARMVRVLHNHAHFRSSPGAWLFLGLTWTLKEINCDFQTLNNDLTAIVSITRRWRVPSLRHRRFPAATRTS